MEEGICTTQDPDGDERVELADPDDDEEEILIEDEEDRRSGVSSDAGGSFTLLFTSRLHTGQKVLHFVSQESMHTAWNPAIKIRTIGF